VEAFRGRIFQVRDVKPMYEITGYVTEDSALKARRHENCARPGGEFDKVSIVAPQ
jgi:hypothetical protein